MDSEDELNEMDTIAVVDSEESVESAIMNTDLHILMNHIDPRQQLRMHQCALVRLGDEFVNPMAVYNELISENLHYTYRGHVEEIIWEKTDRMRDFRGDRYFALMSRGIWNAMIAMHTMDADSSIRMLYTDDFDFDEARIPDITSVDATAIGKFLERNPLGLNPECVYYSLSLDKTVFNYEPRNRLIYTLYLPADYMRQ